MARRTGQKAATIDQVARRAEVSAATVSRVMNGRFVGEPQVAERVRAAAADLRYAPSPLARSLALGETKTVAFVVPDLANPLFLGVLSSVGKAAARDGYRVLVADTAERPEDEPLLAIETRRRCDSIVLCAPRMPEPQLLDMVEALRPVVLVNRSAPQAQVPSVSIDYGSGIRILAQHLVDLGHREIAYLVGPPSSSSNEQRLDALAQFGAEHPDVRITRIEAGSVSDDGYRTAPDVVAAGVTAALAYNDLVAVGLVNGLREAGVRVPDDVSVAGFDDIPFARYVTPSLTTASVPIELVGVGTWSRLRALIREDAPEHDVVFSPRLEARDSTAAPRH